MVLLGFALALAFGWYAVDPGLHRAGGRQAAATPTACTAGCEGRPGLSGDPATGMPYAP